MLSGDAPRPFYTVPSPHGVPGESPPAGAHLERPCTHVLPHRCGAALDVDRLELPETARRAVELVDCLSVFGSPVIDERADSELAGWHRCGTHSQQWAGARAWARRRQTWWTMYEGVSRARMNDALGEYIDMQPAAPK